MARPLIDRIEEARRALNRQRARVEKARGPAARLRAIGRVYAAAEKLEALEARDAAQGAPTTDDINQRVLAIQGTATGER